MGGKNSKSAQNGGAGGGCLACLEGLTGNPRGRVQPDTSPTLVRKVSNYDEAMSIQRPGEGSFNPMAKSPSNSTAGGAFMANWASPAPRSSVGDASPVMDFDLVIEEGETGKKSAVMLDFDGRASQMNDFSKQGQTRSQFEVEQLLCSPGSLPPALSREGREAALRALAPTATYQMLAKVPHELVAANTPEGQNLRRKLMKGATVVFVSAGLPGKRFIYERAASLGVKVVIIEHPDSWARTLEQEGIIAKFVPVDMSKSSEEVFSDAFNAIQELGQDGLTGAVDGVTTMIELSVPLVARLAEALGLPGFLPSSVDSARDKHKTRAALKAAGLPTPRNMLIASPDQVAAAGQHVGFPAVLKPICGAASLGVKKVTSRQELQACYDEVQAELKSLVVSSGALIKADPATTGGLKPGEGVDLTVLLEQYLDGSEVDVDVVMSEGEWRYACVTDNGPTLEPYFNETWAVCPSLLPKDKQVALKELAVNSVKALGFAMGVFHVECKYTSTGPQLIEVNARMGGGQIHECNLRTWGVDLVEETMMLALGIPSRPSVPKAPLASVAYCYVNAPKSGIAGDFGFLDELRQRDDVVWAKQLVKSGTKVVGKEDGMPTWILDLLVYRKDPKDALDFLLKLEANLPVVIT
mmetsp:Transcript_20229/g.47209  ORF Transcript_20229/g.47209 Transcript_20229/m.47209 type:complete len:639 (+) Transcript_20229:86-2002(+)|eukprot:CAMPEP_0178399562 /NCGR_PEP_ID=MMETSP0689_2-20121128/15343_1 /TAXON_ID=160604 /ORGANISM="Amphidinium massartii, Strain CS-259" /LENGTH=638 /DNA_ID=CAMNT_0020020341 /DNA_START=76 /DNA_END=1992 /DNA_ORIENTATION=+